MFPRPLSDRGVEGLDIGRVRCGLRRTAKHVGGPRPQLRLPFRDRGGMHTKLCGHLRQRLLAVPAAKATCVLTMIADRSRHRLALWLATPWGVGEARLRAGNPQIDALW